jgi:hypothetical protein
MFVAGVAMFLVQQEETQTPQSLPVAIVSSISAYLFNTSVRYPGEIETACAAIRSQ